MIYSQTYGKTLLFIPFLKKVTPTIVSNYLTILRISIIPKLISIKINNYCSTFLTHHQYGLRPKRSANCSLAITKQIILQSFELHSQINIICTDISKVFNSINHEILLNKF